MQGDVKVDPIEVLLVWSQWRHNMTANEYNGSIMCSKLDGSDIQVLNNRTRHPHTIALDTNAQLVYWIDTFMYTLNVMDYKGLNVRTVAQGSSLFSTAFSMDFYGKHTYWSTGQTVYRADGNNTEVVLNAYSDIQGIRVLNTGRQETMAVRNYVYQFHNIDPGALVKIFNYLAPHLLSSVYTWATSSAPENEQATESDSTFTHINNPATQHEFNNSDKLLEKLRRLYNERLFTDTTLQVNGTDYRCHRVILCASSHVFEEMLINSETNSPLIVNESDQCCQLFPEFLEYLYTGIINISDDSVLTLLTLSDKYLVRDLNKFPTMDNKQLVTLFTNHVIEKHRDLFTETLSLAMLYRITGNPNELNGKLPVHSFIPRVYTSSKWSSTLEVENYKIFPHFGIKGLTLTTPTFKADNPDTNSQTCLSNEWVVELHPKGIKYHKSLMDKSIEIPELINNTVRLSVRLNKGIGGRTDYIEYVREVVRKLYVFNDEHRVLNIDDLIPFHELNGCTDADGAVNNTSDFMVVASENKINLTYKILGRNYHYYNPGNV
ncbi:unnamed protein product [Oppiella nova]|uniref:BTB domain-containing protein n=1 Tax=Oppiella nova TaxID=334625 RepID=A0A7R9M151_9ACAR|nr:unnamed protein product [Oppiella nova]CAG2168879.1 unnamed protein product [Oppiella nova]